MARRKILSLHLLVVHRKARRNGHVFCCGQAGLLDGGTAPSMIHRSSGVWRHSDVVLRPASSFGLAPVRFSSSDLAQAPAALEPAPLPNSGMLALNDSQSESFNPTRLTMFKLGGVLSLNIPNEGLTPFQW